MITETILKINPNADFSIKDNDVNQITWLNGTTPISVSDIQSQIPIVEFEIAMKKLRAKRNALLAETDYIVTMNLEAGTDIPADWKTYRQSLRDLTNGLTTVEQVNAVVYPTKPE